MKKCIYINTNIYLRTYVYIATRHKPIPEINIISTILVKKRKCFMENGFVILIWCERAWMDYNLVAWGEEQEGIHFLYRGLVLWLWCIKCTRIIIISNWIHKITVYDLYSYMIGRRGMHDDPTDPWESLLSSVKPSCINKWHQWEVFMTYFFSWEKMINIHGCYQYKISIALCLTTI